MKRHVMAFWLLPAKAERELFKRIIQILGRQLVAPAFEPHLTLGCASIHARAARAALQGLEAKSFSLVVRDVYFSPAFTKTLFVRFKRSETLNRVAAQLWRNLDGGEIALVDPHLSLCYKKLTAATQRELARTIRLPFRRVAFDAVKAVLCANPTASAKDVAGWQTVARKRLRT